MMDSALRAVAANSAIEGAAVPGNPDATRRYKQSTRRRRRQRTMVASTQARAGAAGSTEHAWLVTPSVETGLFSRGHGRNH